MPPKKTADKLTDSEKKKIKQENKAKANPKQAEKKSEKNDARRIKRGQMEPVDKDKTESKSKNK